MPQLLYQNSDHLCWVYREGEEYFLDTLCGGAGMYSVCLRLDPDERDAFLADPQSVFPIVRQLCHNPTRYADRLVDDLEAMRMRSTEVKVR